ncbi:MFS transporter [Peristeroidobacter soli]|uniref:MFS transporter n=1 Tax=Peristeroidobacter soli TaxID=2497877 RepID=UPI001C37AE17|nr:MFS transporter [Peristeroidobacter soli]
MTNESKATPGEASGTESAFAPLRMRTYRSLWAASLVSDLGGLIQSVGASWMMLSIVGTADMVALVQTAVALPIMLLSLFAGAMADNIERRKMLLASQAFMVVMSCILSVCTWAGVLTPWLLLSLTFLIGCGGAFYYPAWGASVGDIVPRSQLPSAVALNSMGYNMARSVGPAIGGIIVASAGPAAAFAVNALGKIGLVGVLARWRRTTESKTLPREPLGMAVAAGIRYVSMSPAICTVLARGALFGFGASATMALMPVVAKHLLGGGPFTYGLLSGAFGLGAMAGGLCSAPLRLRLSTEGVVRTASISCASAAAVIGLSSHLWLTMFALVLTGASWVLALSTYNVAVQMATPRWVVARALSIYQMATYGGMAMGSWALGALAGHGGLQLALLTAACVILSNAVVGHWLPVSEVRSLNLDPLWPSHQPETDVPVDFRTGPVVVSVQYRIQEADVGEFLSLMAERQRIRRRDGARNVTLLRDLANREIWIERYETATWLEYIRHTSRVTKDDASLFERLKALHRGPGSPIIQRMLERPATFSPAAQTTAASLTEPVTEPGG